MINSIIVLIGLYLTLGLVLTFYGLRKEEVISVMDDFGTLTTSFLILLFIVTTPAYFIRSAFKRLKVGGRNNVEKGRDEEK